MLQTRLSDIKAPPPNTRPLWADNQPLFLCFYLLLLPVLCPSPRGHSYRLRHVAMRLEDNVPDSHFSLLLMNSV